MIHEKRKNETKKPLIHQLDWYQRELTVEFSLSKDIALVGQTISQGLEQLEGQFSGSNSNKGTLWSARVKYQ